MPSLSGDQISREISKTDPAVVNILITGWVLRADDPRLALFDFYIKKPFDDLDELEDVAARAIELYDERVEGGD